MSEPSCGWRGKRCVSGSLHCTRMLEEILCMDDLGTVSQSCMDEHAGFDGQ
jgi:hypothetical protein